MDNMKKDLTEGSIPQLVKTMAIPVSIGFFFQAMYNITDTYYVGQLSTTALAALALTFPLFFLILSLGGGINISTNALVAKKLGEKKHEEAVEIAAQGISYAFIAGIILGLVGIGIADPVFSLIGGKGELHSLAIEYMNIIFLGSSLFLMFFTLNGILGSIGDTKTGGILMVIGFVLNVFLDPILMYGWFGLPRLEIAGVAIATLIIMLIQVVAMLFIVNKRGMLSKELHHYIPKTNIAKEIISQAIPASLNQASTALGFLIVTRFVSDFGEMAIATFGVGVRIDQLLVLPAIGIAIASISLTGQNYGAKRFDRILETYKVATKYNAIALLIGLVLVIIFSKSLAEAFTPDQQLQHMIVTYLWIVTFSYVPVGVIIISGSVLQGLGKAEHGLALTLMRVFVVLVPLFWIFAYTLDYKEIGIWIALTLSSIIVALISYWYVLKTIKKLAVEG